jgi:hypothetical protein
MTKLVCLTELSFDKYSKSANEKQSWFNTETIIKISDAGNRFNHMNTTEITTENSSFIVKESVDEIKELMTDVEHKKSLLLLMEEMGYIKKNI